MGQSVKMTGSKPFDIIKNSLEKKCNIFPYVQINSLPPGKVFIIFLSSADFLKINFFEIFFQEYH